ncbi:MAG: DUF4339 domain-containing protein [Bryobacterales bacterium]|nr:DUF4339 domain-containing protein [Bryobacterales bacterium]
MMYMIKRGDQEFGPYSGNDIQQYLTSGNIVESDMVRAEGSDRWLTVKDILSKKGQAAGGPAAPTPAPQPSYSPAPTPQPMADPFFDPAPMPQQAPDYGSPEPAWGAPAPSYGAAPDAGMAAMGGGFGAVAGNAGASSAPAGAMKNGAPLPPGMNWVVVLVISMVCGIFGLVWFIMQILWVKKLDPQNRTLPKILTGFGILIASYVISIPLAILLSDSAIGAMLSGLISLAGFGGYLFFFITGILDLKKSLEGYFNAVEPINLKLNPILMIFFAIFYMQYHFNRITTWKTTGTLPQ